MSNNYQNNYFPDDFSTSVHEKPQNNSFFDQNFDHSAAKILELI